MLPLLILVPLAALVVFNLPFGKALRGAAFGLVVLLSLAQTAIMLFCPDALRNSGDMMKAWFQLNLSLQASELSLVMLLTIGIVMFTAAMVGGQMITAVRQRFVFFNILLVSMIGMNGAVLVTDLFSLYVFLEVTSVSSFVLIAFHKDMNALEGAFKYIVMSAVATVMMLGSVALLVMIAGDTSFKAIHDALAVSGQATLAKMAVAMFACGLFVKGGLVPFHGWLPAAYSSAPAAVSVLLAGVVTKVSGIYALVMLAKSVLPASAVLNHVLMAVGAVSIVVGALAALGQHDMKRLLAYSSISQVGYIILGVGCGSPLAMAGAVFHLFNHAIFKSLLFCNSAAVEDRLGTTDMNQLGGLGSKMPWTGATSVVGLLSAAGIPPLSGFWSKLVIIVALWKAGQFAYAVLAVLLSVLTLGYLLSMQRKVFFGKLREELQAAKEARWGILAPELVLAAITIGVGVLLPLMWKTYLLPVDGLN